MDLEVVTLFRELADRTRAEREEVYAQRKTPTEVRIEVESLLRFDGASGESLAGPLSEVKLDNALFDYGCEAGCRAYAFGSFPPAGWERAPMTVRGQRPSSSLGRPR